MKTLWVIFLALLSLSQLQSNNINWSFPPTMLSSVGQSASDPQVAMDGNGNVFAAWVENGRVKASTHRVNMSWSSVVTLWSFGSLIAANCR